MKMRFPKNPSLIRRGENGWPMLRAEEHTRENGIGGYLGNDGNTLINADGCEVLRRIEVNYKESWGGDLIDYFYPAILFLPHDRILAGWTMGKGMVTSFDLEMFDDKEQAWFAAKLLAKYAANKEIEYRESEESEELS